MLIAISFAMLRHYTGGFHMKTANQCLILTVGMFITAGAIISRLNLNTTLTAVFVFVSCIISYVCVCKYAPRDCKNKPIKTKEEFNQLRTNSLKCLNIFVLIETALIVLKFNQGAASISTSCLLVVIAIMPIVCDKFK
jgi:accessory gene regulator protein AgrB